jgi:hypothetical protein
VQPALVIGLGGIGVKILGQLRRQLTAELGRPDELPYMRLLGVDTDADGLQGVAVGDAGQALQSSELLPTRLHRASHYLKPREGGASTDSWLNPKLLYRIPRDQASASLRPLGRLALVDNYRAFARRLQTELQTCCEQALAPAAREALAPRGPVPRVYIVTCLAGNTGSGMFLDVAYIARDTLRRLGYDQAEVVGLFCLPASDAGARATSLANAYAALAEVHHFSRHPFSARYGTGDPQGIALSVHDDGPPFTRCILQTLPRQNGAGSEAATAQAILAAGDLLVRDVATPLGQAADQLRQQRLDEAGPRTAPVPSYHVVGLSRLSWPRQPLLNKGARRVSRRLVESWMSKDARPIADELTRWVDEKWDAVGLRSEALIGRLHELCEKVIKQPADRLVTGITGPLGEALMPDGKSDGSVPLGPAVAAVADLDRLLGVPEECRAANQPPPVPGSLETALAEATGKLTDVCEQRLAEHVVRLIEDPRFRLAGAEEALRRLSAATERALEAQETLARELNERAVLLYQRVQKILEAPAPPSTQTSPNGRKLTLTRATPAKAAGVSAGDVLELIRQYPKARYHALVLHYINRLYVGLRGQLSDQLREVGFCRQRLGELANLLQPASASPEPAVLGRTLLPAGCPTLDDAVEQLEKELTREDLLTLDQDIQLLIRQQYRALVNVCMGSSAMVRTLAPQILTRARQFLAPRFIGTSVAELLLAPRGQEDRQRTGHAVTELTELYKRAEPKTALARADAQLELTLVPGDPYGLELQRLVKAELPQLAVVSDRPDEIVCYREQVHFGPALDQLGPTAQEAYRQRLAMDPSSLHTREDLAEWQPLAAAAH